MYRIGFPGWKLAARFGVPLMLRIDVRRDDEAKVFIATSEDLRGLVVEAATMEELFKEASFCVGMLLEERLKAAPRAPTSFAWPGEPIPA